MTVSALLVALLATGTPAQAVPLTDDEITRYIEPAIRQDMIDPESMRVAWPYTWARRSDRIVTCGVLNSRNRMGGYSGETFVLLVRQDGQQPFYRIAQRQNASDGVTVMCEQLIDRGQIERR